jgi:MFS family permease
MPLSSLAPLRHRNYALVWSAGVVSNVGTWMQTVAVGALVTERTGQARWTALVAVAAFLPMGLLAPIGGAMADRLDRRRCLIVGNVVGAALATGLALLSATGRASPGAVTFVVLLHGCTFALTMPFYQAMIPDLVPREDLLAAASLGSAQYNLGRVVGPALAAVIIAATSFTWAFVVNAVSFFAFIGALALVRLPPHHPTDDGDGLFERIRAGARAMRAEPGCRAAITFISVAAFLLAPFIALIPAKASLVVDGGAKATASATGALTTAQGVGAVVGALLIAPLALRFGRRRMIVVYMLGTAAALVAYAASGTVAFAVLALVLVGGLYIGILSGLNTVVQLRAPAEFRARILSLYFVALGSIYPIGALVQGAVADRIGLDETTVLAAAAFGAFLVVVAVTRPSLLRALDDPEEVADEPSQLVGTLQGEQMGSPLDLDEAGALDR